MGVRERMAAAKGAILALLTPAYQRRDRIALVVFRDAAAELLLPPTGSVALARRHLRQLPTGGATPLAEGLLRAWRLVRAERRKDPHVVATLALISDGGANVPLGDRRDCEAELLQLASRIHNDGISAVAIDTLPCGSGAAPMRRIADRLGARYHHVDHLRSSAIVRAVEAI
jgi:magnesium chelatase subunit D